MDNRNLISHIKDNWFMYLFIGQLIFSYAVFSSRIEENDKRIVQLEEEQHANQVTLSEIKSRLASIDTNLEYLKRNQ
jgi:septation ring formation regulator EzrA